MATHVGEIMDFNIHLLDLATMQPSATGSALSASMELKINDRLYIFGGPDLYASIPNDESIDFFSHFVLRCLQVAKAKSQVEMFDEIVKVHLEDDRVVGIASMDSDEYFYPVPEFEHLANGDFDED